MKIVYKDIPAAIPRLAEISSGQVFRPINSLSTFMRCDLNADSPFLSERVSNIWEHTTFVGSEPFDDKDEFDENCDYDELIVCVNLTTGGVTLLYDGIEVERLDCELVVKEGE